MSEESEHVAGDFSKTDLRRLRTHAQSAARHLEAIAEIAGDTTPEMQYMLDELLGVATLSTEALGDA